MDSEIGKKYGFLTVMQYTGEKYRSTKIYLCECECGNTKVVNINKLKTGHVKSCGCKRYNKIIDLTNRKYGRLKVLSFHSRENNKTLWNCVCECGNYKIIDGHFLKNGAIVSCGCKNDENKQSLKFNRINYVEGTNISSISSTRKVNKNNTSGYKGVSWNKEKNKWYAQIYFKGASYNLGYYDQINEAIKARKEGEKIYFSKIIKKHKKNCTF